MVAEFDAVAGWTADAVEQLGERHAIPAACRGSASPAALAWLAEACELSSGTRLLDVGAGAGGPAAWAAERFGVRPILLEPMPAAGRAAARLFGLPMIAADGRRIPLRTGSADAAWCLGMLCTVQEKATVLSEIHRVLKPGASLGFWWSSPEARRSFRPRTATTFPPSENSSRCSPAPGSNSSSRLTSPARRRCPGRNAASSRRSRRDPPPAPCGSPAECRPALERPAGGDPQPADAVPLRPFQQQTAVRRHHREIGFREEQSPSDRPPSTHLEQRKTS
jgi:SAM-dependent methyltransferase